MTITGSDHDWQRWAETHEAREAGDRASAVVRHASVETASQRVRRLAQREPKATGRLVRFRRGE